MPYVEATFFDQRFEDETFNTRMVEAITKAVSSVLGEAAGNDTTIVLHSVPPSRWGYGGKVMG